jgi:hypothetical protein
MHRRHQAENIKSTTTTQRKDHLRLKSLHPLLSVLFVLFVLGLHLGLVLLPGLLDVRVLRKLIRQNA